MISTNRIHIVLLLSLVLVHIPICSLKLGHSWFQTYGILLHCSSPDISHCRQISHLCHDLKLIIVGISSPSMSRRLMQPSSEIDQFTFSHSFRQAHDDELKTADNSDNPSNRHHSLSDQDYQNVTKGMVNRKTAYMNRSEWSKQGSTSPAK